MDPQHCSGGSSKALQHRYAQDTMKKNRRTVKEMQTIETKRTQKQKQSQSGGSLQYGTTYLQE
jgi:hypothetical protein